MRYYRTETLVEHGASELVVIAEVIGWVDPDRGPVANMLADGPDGLTREQLLDLPGGRRALWAWERGDNSAYARDRRAFMLRGDLEDLEEAREPAPRPMLVVVTD